MKYNLLILEDDLPVRNSLAAFFEDYDFGIYKAEDAETALKVVSDNTIDLVIVDIRLPGISGLDFIKRVLEINDYTAFIIHTGSPEYKITTETLNNPRVSNTIFKKPIEKLTSLLDEVNNMSKISLAYGQNKKNSNH